MKQYSEEEKSLIKAVILKKLDKAFEVNSYGPGANTPPFWMNLLFILDKFNTGCYYGTISLKIQGTSCMDIKELEVTHKVREHYEDPPRG